MTLYNGYTKKVVRLNWVYRSWINNYTSRCKKHSEIFTGKQIDLLLFRGRKMIQIQNVNQEDTKNITRIKYISIGGKVYRVTDLSVSESYIEAAETELSTDEVPGDELWSIGEFGQYKLKLINRQKKIKVININQWKQSKQR